MQTKQPAEHQADDEKHLRKQLRSIIGEQVIHVLGQPSGLQKVQVRKLWDDRYRVNIYIGPDPTSATSRTAFSL